MVFDLTVIALLIIMVYVGGALVWSSIDADDDGSMACIGVVFIIIGSLWAASNIDDLFSTKPSPELQACQVQYGKLKHKYNVLAASQTSEGTPIDTPKSKVEAPKSKVKPLGTQAEYRVVFDEDLEADMPNPKWAFQKFHKDHWVTILKDIDKASLEQYAQDYVNKVQSPSKVITVKKEMKPVLSDSSKESLSAVEVQ